MSVYASSAAGSSESAWIHKSFCHLDPDSYTDGMLVLGDILKKSEDDFW